MARAVTNTAATTEIFTKRLSNVMRGAAGAVLILEDVFGFAIRRVVRVNEAVVAGTIAVVFLGRPRFEEVLVLRALATVTLAAASGALINDSV